MLTITRFFSSGVACPQVGAGYGGGPGPRPHRACPGYSGHDFST